MKYSPALLFVLAAIMACCRQPAEEPIVPIDDADEMEIASPRGFGPAINQGGNVVSKKTVELGRHLFYEKRLSGDNTVSCGSCHQQSKGFSDPSRLSVGVGGRLSKRQSMSLANLMWTNKLFWDGRVDTFEEQVPHPIHDINEMASNFPDIITKLSELPKYREMFKRAYGSEEVTADRIIKALTHFQKTLVSANSTYDKYLRGEYEPTAQERLGMQLFFEHPFAGVIRGANCGDCHLNVVTFGKTIDFEGFHVNGIQPDLSDTTVADPGLERVTGNIADRGKFRTPGLRNIAVTAPYMHNGQISSLNQVLDHYNNPNLIFADNVDQLILEGSNRPDGRGLGMTPQEKQAVLAFLQMLTDEEFLTNPDFSEPVQ